MKEWCRIRKESLKKKRKVSTLVSQSVRRPVAPSVDQSVNAFVTDQSIRTPAHLSIHQSIRPSVHPSIHPSIYLSVRFLLFQGIETLSPNNSNLAPNNLIEGSNSIDTNIILNNLLLATEQSIQQKQVCILLVETMPLFNDF